MDLWTEHDVSLGAIRLRVAVRGSGQPVLFLHDCFFHHGTWDRVAERLGHQFQLYAPDLPGFGNSAKPPPARYPYGASAFSDAIAGLIGGMGTGRLPVVGHGVGASTAILLAARHPELVSQLTLIAPFCYPINGPSVTGLFQLPGVAALLLRQFWGQTLFRSFFRTYQLGANSGPFPVERIDDYYDAFNSPAARGGTVATLRSLADPRDIAASLRRIQAPTLVLWGAEDHLVPAAHGHRLAREVRGAGFQLLPGGHCPQEQYPDELAFELERMLLQQRPSIF